HSGRLVTKIRAPTAGAFGRRFEAKLRYSARKKRLASKKRCRTAADNRMVRRPPTVPVVLAGFTAFLDLYATQPLLPLFARLFHASNFAVSLTVTAPTMAVAVAAPLVGRLGDLLGRR